MKTPIDQIEKNHKEMSQFENVFRMAEHYNINNDLFDRAYFRPVCDLQVAYDNQSVYYGNRIQAEKVRLFITVTVTACFNLDILRLELDQVSNGTT